MVSTTYYATYTIISNQVIVQEVTISNLCQRHLSKCSHKKAVKANGETMEANIVNLFGFSLRDSIFEWGCEPWIIAQQLVKL
jgi:hypothetical protein